MSEKNNTNRKIRGGQIRTDRSEKQNRRKATHGSSQSSPSPTRRESVARKSASYDASDILDSYIETPDIAAVTRRVERWVSVNRPVHLVGPTGCGKTSLAMHAASKRDRPVVWINGDAEIETSDLVGEFSEQERVSVRDNYVHNVTKSTDIIRDRWVDNPLTVAVREGATLVYNEFSRTKPSANNALLSVFEEGILELPGQRGDDRVVEVHPEFRAILTSNDVEYAGVHEPQDALLDRLVGVYMDYYGFETEVEIVSTHAPNAPTELVRECVQLLRSIRDEFEWNLGTRGAIIAVEGLMTMSKSERQNTDTLTEVFVDVLSSKVSNRTELQEIRSRIRAEITSERE